MCHVVLRHLLTEVSAGTVAVAGPQPPNFRPSARRDHRRRCADGPIHRWERGPPWGPHALHADRQPVGIILNRLASLRLPGAYMDYDATALQ
jgi:hypothetical protein